MHLSPLVSGDTERLNPLFMFHSHPCPTRPVKESSLSQAEGSSPILPCYKAGKRERVVTLEMTTTSLPLHTPSISPVHAILMPQTYIRACPWKLSERWGLGTTQVPLEVRAWGQQIVMFGEFTTNLNRLMDNLDNVRKLFSFLPVYSKPSSMLNLVLGPIVKFRNFVSKILNHQ